MIEDLIEDMPKCETCGGPTNVYLEDSDEWICFECFEKIRCYRCGGMADLFREVTGEWLCLSCYEKELGLKL
jgi:ribosomal protein L37AE/L43A